MIPLEKINIHFRINKRSSLFSSSDHSVLKITERSTNCSIGVSINSECFIIVNKNVKSWNRSICFEKTRADLLIFICEVYLEVIPCTALSTSSCIYTSNTVGWTGGTGLSQYRTITKSHIWKSPNRTSSLANSWNLIANVTDLTETLISWSARSTVSFTPCNRVVVITSRAWCPRARGASKIW